MSLILVIIINIILIFIAYVVLSSRIKKSSVASVLERYTREVENLIVQLNGAVDDVVNIAEDRIEELKKLIENTEKLLKNPKVKKALTATSRKAAGQREEIAERNTPGNLMEKTAHLLSMGHTKEEIAKILKINRAEVDFLESLSRK